VCGRKAEVATFGRERVLARVRVELLAPIAVARRVAEMIALGVLARSAYRAALASMLFTGRNLIAFVRAEFVFELMLPFEILGLLRQLLRVAGVVTRRALGVVLGVDLFAFALELAVLFRLLVGDLLLCLGFGLGAGEALLFERFDVFGELLFAGELLDQLFVARNLGLLDGVLFAQRFEKVTVADGKAKLADLRPHPDNITVYGEKDSVADLVKSIKGSGAGILEPLLITPVGEIIGGHRRYRAAQELRMDEVPVKVFDSTDKLEIGKALLEHNRQRVKTGVQIANEAKYQKELHRKLREREKQNGKAQGEKLPPEAKGKTRDAVGDELGLSGRTVDKAIKTADAIEKLRTEGKEDDAQEVETALNKSIERGLKVATAKGAIKAPKTRKTAAKKAAASAEPRTDVDASAGDADSTTAAEPTSENLSEASATPPPEPTPPEPDSNTALTHADVALAFLRSDAAKAMKDQQRRDWTKALKQIVACKEALSL